MKQIYYSDDALKKKLLRQNARSYLRYKVGLSVCAVFVIATVAALAVLWFRQDGEDVYDKLLHSVEILLIPILVVCFASAVACSGGRGAWMSRWDEMIGLDGSQMTYRYTPSGAAWQNGGITEIVTTVCLDSITKAEYVEKWNRLEIIADYSVIKRSNDGTSPAEEKYSQTPLSILMYFQNSEELVLALKKAAENNRRSEENAGT